MQYVLKTFNTDNFIDAFMLCYAMLCYAILC